MSEEGAGAVLAAGLVAAVVAGFVLAGGAGAVLEAQLRVTAAADSAALAGADAELGNATGEPCVAASVIATTAHVRLERCAVRGPLVRVRLSTVAVGVALGAEAVAGPPPPR
ncbi:MAG: hypothetical protein HIU86_02550 [Acidobacteria bacterium]|nr:hypothetical protein [Acidobacteriota bacterium]